MGALSRPTWAVARHAPTGKSDLLTYVPATFELVFYSLLVGSLLGLVLGVASALRPGRPVDVSGRFVAMTGLSLPNFWVALLLQFLFFSVLGLLPFGGRLDTGVAPPETITGLYTVDSVLTGRFDLFVQSVSHLILPVIALSLGEMGLVARITRASMLEVLGVDYIRTARAKVPPRASSAGTRSATRPPSRSSGWSSIAAPGTVLVESISPGRLGRYMADAISPDYNAIMG
jgi:peptide/nickel transport system permease protein